VEEVPAGDVRGRAVRRVADGKEEAARVAVEPVAVELVPRSQQLELSPGEAGEAVARPPTGADLPLDRLRPDEGRERPERRVVAEVVDAGEALSVFLPERRLRVRTDQLVANPAPVLPRAPRVGRLAHLVVEIRDPAAPVEQRRDLTQRLVPHLDPEV